MLRGRETLVRMVGKRRKIESHDVLLNQILNEAKATQNHVASGQADIELNPETILCVKDDFKRSTMVSFSAGKFKEDIIANDDVKVSKWKTDDNDLVPCPVCGKSIQGTDIIINEHLDICLTRGSKRKLSQRTLLQFNVGSSAKQNIGAGKVPLERKDFKHQNMDKQHVASPITKTSSHVQNKTSCLNGSSRKFDSGIQSREKYNPLNTLVGANLDKTEELVSGVEEFNSKNSMEILSSLSKEDVEHTDTLSNHQIEAYSARDLRGLEKAVESEKSVRKCRKFDGSLDTNHRCDRPFEDGGLDNVIATVVEEHTGTLSNHQIEAYSLTDFREVERAVESEKAVGKCRKFDESLAMNRRCNRHFEGGGLDNVISSVNEEENAYASRDGLSDLSSSLSNLVASFKGNQDGGCKEHINIESIPNNSLLGVLETFIVGRKFNQETKVEQEASISVMRDLQNPKDKNAIKVIYSGSEFEPVLGHLPRELALHLSPLLDKGSIQIQGVITNIPDNAFAPVPIRLFVQKTEIDGQEDFEKGKLLKSAWLQAVQAVKLLNSFPSDNPKYQRNFKIMIQSVLEHHSYLFTDEEKTLLGSFESLSGDSQRLFIRLYQRKGPWFRISALFYTDITNVKSACEELVAAGYLSSSELETECFQDEMKEILSVLSLPELRQLALVGLSKKKREVGLAKKDELLQWLLSAALKKKEKSLLGASGTIPSLYNLFAEVAGSCLKISDLAGFLLWRSQRLFFLNGVQDLSAFLLVDLGLRKYPAYSCNPTQSIFSNRADLLSYEQALVVAQVMDTSLDANDMPKVKKCLEISSTYLTNCQSDKNMKTGFCSMFLARFSAAWVHTKILTLGVSVLERERRYEEAIELLKSLLSRSCCPGQRGYWTLRLSVDLEHIGQIEESLLVAEKGMHDAWIRAGDRMGLQRRILRLGKPPRRWKKPSFATSVCRKIKEVYVRGRPLNSTTGAKSIFYGYDEQQCSVEQLALQYYAREESGAWQGVHSEGGIWMTYFGLLMWDVLFVSVPDVFWTPFQTAPLDLQTDSFYQSRESLIEAQLSKIRMGEAEKILAASWEAYCGTSCQGVNWERYTLTDLQTIASCIGGPGLAAVCKLLAEDYGSWSSGMPDLLLWRTFLDKEDTACSCSCLHHSGGSEPCSCSCLHHSEGSEPCSCSCQDTSKKLRMVRPRGEAKLVEVKGPRYQLSEQQRAWILVLMDAGLSTEVCKITELLKGDE